MLAINYNNTINIWINALEQYSFADLCAKPSPNSWSLGQVYMHLMADNNYYIEQIKPCLVSNEHSIELSSPNAQTLFLNNDFPDEIIEGHPDNYLVPQPQNKEQLMQSLTDLKNEMNAIALQIAESSFKGKTKHPGFGYFSAMEWFNFAEIHLRHHFRQKKRIDYFLAENRPPSPFL